MAATLWRKGSWRQVAGEESLFVFLAVTVHPDKAGHRVRVTTQKKDVPPRQSSSTLSVPHPSWGDNECWR